MMNPYRCDICGCYLDPGEGGRCDECRRETRNGRAQKERLLKIEIAADGAELTAKINSGIQSA